MGSKRDQRAQHTTAHAEDAAAVNCAAPVSPAVEVGPSTRLVDIDVYRYGIIRSQVFHSHDATPIVRCITLDERGARQLLHDLLGAFV